MSNPYEIIGTAFGLLSVWLTIRKSIWCWPTGLVNVVLFFVMFYQVKLYAELITYSVFFVLGIYGWWEWSHGGENRSKLPVSRTPHGVSLVLLIVALVWAPVQGYGFQHYTDAALPYWDSIITVLSLLAQWMLARKYLGAVDRGGRAGHRGLLVQGPAPRGGALRGLPGPLDMRTGRLVARPQSGGGNGPCPSVSSGSSSASSSRHIVGTNT